MRRRQSAGSALTAEELSALFVRLIADNRDSSLEVRTYAIQQGLAAYGYDAVQAIRARYWLRHGKPAHYVWNDNRASRTGALGR